MDETPVNLVFRAHESVGAKLEQKGYRAKLTNTTNGRVSTLEFTYSGTPGVVVWCKDKTDESADDCTVNEGGKPNNCVAIIILL